MSAKQWAKAKAVSRVDCIGEDRADAGRQRAALGIMSTIAKLNNYDPKVLLPNPPPEPELTLEQQAAAFEAYAASHNKRIAKG